MRKILLSVLLVNFLAFHPAHGYTTDYQVQPKDIYEGYIVQKVWLHTYAMPHVSISGIGYTEHVLLPKDAKTADPSQIKVVLGRERKRPFAVIHIPAYVQGGEPGSTNMVSSFTLNVEEQEQPTGANQRTTKATDVAHSALAQGTWYKIGITKTGFYKIDYAFIQSLGLSPANVNPANLRVLGNGGNMLSEDNSVARPADLVENAIMVSGGAGGVFNNGDYAVFYGIGPVAWNKDSLNKTFTHTNNLYTDTAYYFISFDQGAGRRIGQQSTEGTPNQSVTDDEMPTLENNSVRRTVSVSSFYMDETEVSNASYREYTYWLGRVYGNDYPEKVQAQLPDSTVWRSPLAYNEPYVKNYFRQAAYNNYPVVGVNWYQASEFCKWRTDRVNEYILIQLGAIKPNPEQSGEDVFTLETYMNGQYQGRNGSSRKLNLDPSATTGDDRYRPYNYSDGVFFPDYRLPTEAEWEYAALGLIGNNPTPENKRRRGEEVVTDRNTLPWGPKNTTRYGLHNQYQGEFEGNYMRAKGDAMGVAGGLNDNADITAPVHSFLPNAFGLYNMAGNVNEWVMDTYRPTTDGESEFRPFRGNVYTKPMVQEDGTIEDRDSVGHVPYTNVTTADLLANGRYETKNSDLNSYHDGDSTLVGANYTYAYGVNSLINDSTKIYKGGSWADRAYWLSPGTRRYQQGNTASATIGFRCVMDRLGSPDGDEQPGGNSFGQAKRHKR